MQGLTITPNTASVKFAALQTLENWLPYPDKQTPAERKPTNQKPKVKYKTKTNDFLISYQLSG